MQEFGLSPPQMGYVFSAFMLAPIAFGYILERWGSWTIPFYVAAGFLAVGSWKRCGRSMN
jgi:cyanate permease